MQALFKRHYDAAIEIFSKALAGAPVEDGIDDLLLQLGLTQQRAGDVAAARATYQQAVQEVQRELKKVTLDSHHEAGLHAGLGRAYAGLGEAASAVAEGQKAMAMWPTSKDPFEGPAQEENMAEIYALLGDAEHAIPILKRLLQIPYGICDYSGVAATRSDMGSNPQRSALSGIGRRKETVNLKNFTRFRSSWFKVRPRDSAAVCITLCVTRQREMGRFLMTETTKLPVQATNEG